MINLVIGFLLRWTFCGCRARIISWDTPHQDEFGDFLDPDKIHADVLEELSGRKDAGKPYDFSVTLT